MPNKNDLTFIVSKNAQDLAAVRLPGQAKPFEQMTISELTQLRPGSESASSYNINAVSSDVTISTSSILNELAHARGQEAVHVEIANSHVREALSGKDLKVITNIRGLPR